MPIDIHTIGDDALAASLRAGRISVRRELNKLVRKHGNLLATKIKGRASGRPGPNAPTGDYRRSWKVEFHTQEGGGTVATIGTNAPQGRRLEFGFTGRDSLGRNYNQPPFPHVGPSHEETQAEFAADAERMVQRIVAVRRMM